MRDEQGAATLLVVAATGLLLFVGVALSAVTGIVVAHRRAQAAADLAALAAATALQAAEPGCERAGEVAALNGASLVSCAVDGREATVEVRVRGPRIAGRAVDPVAAARAGPT